MDVCMHACFPYLNTYATAGVVPNSVDEMEKGREICEE